MRLQVNVIVGEQVFPGAPFEIPAEALAALRGQMGPGVLPAGVAPNSAAFSLRRCQGVWQVVFEGDYIYHRTFDKAARTAKSVRQAMNRSIALLDEARDELGRPHSVLVRFAAHLKQHLLGASLAKDVPTGRLVYEPPAGVRWA